MSQLREKSVLQGMINTRIRRIEGVTRQETLQEFPARLWMRSLIETRNRPSDLTIDRLDQINQQQIVGDICGDAGWAIRGVLPLNRSVSRRNSRNLYPGGKGIATPLSALHLPLEYLA